MAKFGPPTGVKIDEVEMDAVRALARSSSRAVSDRARVVLCAVEGLSCRETAAVLGWSLNGVSDMRGKWKRGGIAAVLGTKNPGREPVLARAAMTAAGPLLADRGQVWTVPRLGAALRATGVLISDAWLWKVLKKTGGRSAVSATR